jgi:hypothetical protein
MPLARIITESVDDSLELTMQLRARGFLVEIVSPDQIPDAPADLEVRLEECSPEEVLSKAAQVTESEDLWVFVAPGALDDGARPIRTIPLLPHAFDVPITTIIPNFKRKRPAEAGAEKNSSELTTPLMQATPAHELAEIPLGSGNGSAKSEITADLKREPALAAPVIRPSGPAQATPETQHTKVKVVVLPKLTEVPQIPGVPERPKPANIEPVTKTTPRRMRLRGPYKISFRTGARFWKAIAVSAPLTVVAALLVAVAVLRPHLPPAAKPGVSPAPSSPSAGVKPGKAPLAPPASHSSASSSPASSTPAAPAVPQVTGGALPQVTAKPVLQAPTTPTAKASPDALQNSSGKLASSPVANESNKAATRVNKTHPVRRHAASSEADVVAEDTVVFYDRKPASSAKAPQNPSGKR